jgi:Ca2+-binding EF-hand superfamily protein
MRNVMVGLVVAGLSISPAFAQTQTPAGQTRSSADCESNFKAADKNGDGVLSKQEMTDSSMVVPTALSNMDSVSMQQFISACTAGNSKGG